ncbi:MAG: thioredoxin domain-containing protein, partial [Polyangia bacterium]
MPNRLESEQSPYLRQHAENPVDWLPFGKEAFAEAERLDRPILLSIGYSACHWCHVMAHESFENAATAKLMNERFVNIKVDREELPDVDQIYQRALALQGESGGWPLTMFLTPSGTPYFGGTYFPPEDRYGRPGFPRILVALSDAWHKDRESILGHAKKYTDGLAHLAARELDGGDASALTDAALDTAIDRLLGRVDVEHAGFGGAPKFPNASALRLLLRGARRARRKGRDGAALEAAFLAALTTMAEGGIYDQLGGGFARYATDRVWLVPHFEKMLYDNGQLMRLYAEGYQRTRDPLYARVLRETAAFMERELRAPEGGLYTALDADSDGVEGLFYAWTWAELEALLSPSELALVATHWGAKPEGNWKDPHGHGPELANVLSIVERGGEAELTVVREKLFAARASRVRPGTDDKILSGMNGLALTGLSEAARVLDDPTILEGARRTAAFLLDSLRGAEGRMRRTWKGEARLPGTLDDHAFVAEGLL